MGWWLGIGGTKVGDGPADYIGSTLDELKKKMTFEDFLTTFKNTLESFSSELVGNFPLENFRAIVNDQEVLPSNIAIHEGLQEKLGYTIKFIIEEINELFKEKPTIQDIFANYEFVIYDLSNYFKSEINKSVRFKADNN